MVLRVPYPARSWLALGAAWTALVAVMLVTRSLPAAGVAEASIYSAVPMPVWVAFTLVLAVFAALVLTTRRNPVAWLSALGGLAVASVTLHSLPQLRGYEFYGRADSATYIGNLQSQLESGQLAADNFYPAASLVAHALVTFADVPTDWVWTVGRVLPLTVYVLGSVILGRCIFGSQKWDSFVAVGSLLPLAGAYVASFEPPGFAIAMAPLAISTLFPEVGSHAMGRRARIVLLLTFAFIHPLACLVLLAVAVIVQVTLRAAAGKGANSELTRSRDLSTSVILLAVSFAAWIAPSVMFARQLTAARDAVMSGAATSPGVDALALAGRAGLDTLELVALPIATNLGVLLAAGMGFIACIWGLAVKRGSGFASRDRLLVLAGIEVLLGAAFVASILAPIHLDLFRFLHFIAIVAPVLLATVAAAMGARLGVVAASVIVGVGLVSIPLAFPSPWLRTPSDLVPSAEIAGVRWLLEANSGPDAVPVMSLQGIHTDVDLVLGSEGRRRREEMLNRLPVPDHFGNDGGNAIRLANPTRALLAVTIGDEIAYTRFWSGANRINQMDLDLLESDRGVSRVYTNDAIDIYVAEPDPRADSVPTSP